MDLGKWPMAMGRSVRLMWRYEKRLQYPVNITTPNPDMALFILAKQFWAPICKSIGFTEKSLKYVDGFLLLIRISSEEVKNTEYGGGIYYEEIICRYFICDIINCSCGNRIRRKARVGRAKKKRMLLQRAL